MTMDELLRSEVFLRALKESYEKDLQRSGDEAASEELVFSPAFLRKMELLINGGGTTTPSDQRLL